MGNRLPASVRNAVLKRDAGKCVRCPRNESLHVHHVLARADGGEDVPENLITLCAACHAEWHAVEMLGVEFGRWMDTPAYPGLLVMYEAMLSIDEFAPLARATLEISRLGLSGWLGTDAD